MKPEDIKIGMHVGIIGDTYNWGYHITNIEGNDAYIEDGSGIFSKHQVTRDKIRPVYFNAIRTIFVKPT